MMNVPVVMFICTLMMTLIILVQIISKKTVSVSPLESVDESLKGGTKQTLVYLYLQDGAFVCSLNLDGKQSTSFILDTGFAGTPILNLNQSSPPHGCTLLEEKSSFSLASLGRVQKHTAQQVNCPIVMNAIEGPHDRRFLLMHLDKETPHILTIDFLLSWGDGVSLELGGECPHMTLGRIPSPPPGFQIATRNINGAYAIRLDILSVVDDDGHTLLGGGWFIIDTGSPAPLTIGRTLGDTLGMGHCQSHSQRFVKQIGVNRESICSLVSRQMVARVPGIPQLDIITPILINDVDTPGMSDGYIGIGMLTRWQRVAFHRKVNEDTVSVSIGIGASWTNPLCADTHMIDDAIRDSC